MFLIDRPLAPPAIRADLMPRQLFGGPGDLVRSALMARPPVADPASAERRGAAQLDRARPAPVRRRKAG